LGADELIFSQTRRAMLWLVLAVPIVGVLAVVAATTHQVRMLLAVVAAFAVWAVWAVVIWWTWRITVRQIRAEHPGTEAQPAARRHRPAALVATQFEVITRNVELRGREEMVETVDVVHGMLRVGVGVMDYQTGMRGLGYVKLDVLRGGDVLASSEGTWGTYLTLKMSAGRYSIKVRCEGHRRATCLLKYQDLAANAVLDDQAQWENLIQH